ncbi:MAG: hypothetical protein AB1531_01940 [Chloroflexota bacterium]
MNTRLLARLASRLRRRKGFGAPRRTLSLPAGRPALLPVRVEQSPRPKSGFML